MCLCSISFYCQTVLHCMDTLYFIYPFVSPWTFGLFPPLGWLLPIMLPWYIHVQAFAWTYALIFLSFFKDFISLFYRERKLRTSGRSGRQREKEKQTPCWAGSPMQDLIPAPWDPDLSQRQMLNQLSHPGALGFHFLRSEISASFGDRRLTFLATTRLFSKVAASFYIPTSDRAGP